jgi:peptidoglycan/LPS O-acetylase OafA/YrhL
VRSPAPSSAHERFLATRYFGSLDGLRALAVLAVVWHHTAGSGPGTTGIAGRGFLGVELFFGISGFLITTLLLRERDRYGSISLRAFYVRRSLRIFPLYYAVLGLYVVLTLATGRRHTAAGRSFLHHLPAFATYTTDWFVARGLDVTFYLSWSLATEEQFYLLWPPLLVGLLLLGRGRTRWPLTALVVLLTVDAVVTAATGRPPHDLLVTVVTSLSTPILTGSALALLAHTPRGYAALRPVLGHPAAAPVLLLVVLVIAQVGAPLIPTGLVLAALVAACCLREDHPFAPVLRWRPLREIGVVSYGVYLLHLLAANVVRGLLGLQQSPWVFLGTVPLVLVLAWLSHRYVEGPLLRRKRRFERVGPGPSAVPLTAGPVRG